MKRHIIVDANGIPLAAILSAANVHDMNMLEDVVDAIALIKRSRGCPRKRPDKLHADKACANMGKTSFTYLGS